MSSFNLFIGIDIAKGDFTGSIYSSADDPIPVLAQVPNNVSGFERFESWLIENNVTKAKCIICLEATGVYGEALSYWFTAKGYKVAVEPPLKVKRAFNIKGHKNDKVDSRQIAEYACRFKDKLNIWRPKQDVVEQIKVLLTAREQLVQQKTASTNTLKAFKKKVVQTPLANEIYEDNLKRLNSQIIRIEEEIQKQIDKHPDLKKTVSHLKSIPGVGLLLATNFLVATDGFENDLALQYRKAAAFIGICPYEYSSGSSVYRKPKTPKYGPSGLRKLLHLAARSVITHKEGFRKYYVLKQAQGKENRLILNNVANKLLKIMCAIVRTQQPYFVGHISVHPQNALINT